MINTMPKLWENPNKSLSNEKFISIKSGNSKTITVEILEITNVSTIPIKMECLQCLKSNVSGLPAFLPVFGFTSAKKEGVSPTSRHTNNGKALSTAATKNGKRHPYSVNSAVVIKLESHIKNAFENNTPTKKLAVT